MLDKNCPLETAKEWPGDERSLENYRAARNKAFREMDLQYARLMLRGKNPPDDVLILALHKARYECTDLEPEYRRESGAWLRERGYGRMTGEPVLPEGDLPK